MGERQESERAVDLLRVYGLVNLTIAEQRARIGVLDRMGALAPSERCTFDAVGLLVEERRDG